MIVVLKGGWVRQSDSERKSKRAFQDVVSGASAYAPERAYWRVVR